MIDYNTVYTICPFCGTGCGIMLEVMNGRLAGVLPCKTNPINQGKLCIKGWSAHEFVHSPDRLQKPLVRKDGRLEEVEWDEALSFIATRLKALKEARGPNSFGALSSAKCTNEENYLLQKFTRAVMGTNNIDHCARL